MMATFTLVALPNAVGFAREFTRSTLVHLPLREVADNAELIVSELVTNAVEATGLAPSTPVSEISRRHLVRLALSITGNALYIEVWDGQNGRPVRRSVDGDAEHGRGLLLVEALSQRWGTTPSPRGGKTVWCVIALDGHLPAEARAQKASAPAPLWPRRSSPREARSAFYAPGPLGQAKMRRVLEGLARL
ncbi:ATP-binding protein [Nocardiopsis rhodophaea]|uniref:ATP-binding protein n=1 Tax=Nocardiopsis rhodophaea TaxID=280238 RepID=UPI0031E1A469